MLKFAQRAHNNHMNMMNS